jgi:hypothetical protein
MRISKYCIFTACLLMACEAEQSVTAQTTPSEMQYSNHATTEKKLSDCVRELKARSEGGWCELRVSGSKPGISAVWPEIDYRIRQRTGPSSVLTAWNSAAYDRENKLLYFHGGGHADYGGNEVYRFDLEGGEWRRLTDPSPLEFYSDSDKYHIWIPDLRLVPGATHTYDGLVFNPNTETIVLLNMGPANGSRVQKEDVDLGSPAYLPGVIGRYQYEFNPSEDTPVAGLEPLGWRRIGSEEWTYPRSAILPDGDLLLGDRHRLYTTRMAPDAQLTPPKLFSQQADWGDGIVYVDEVNNRVWSLHRKALLSWDLGGRAYEKIPVPNGMAKSLAVDEAGTIVSWDGGARIFSYKPNGSNSQWSVRDWSENGPNSSLRGKVYGKWVHVEGDIFVGLSHHSEGVWVYRHVNSDKAFSYSETNIQHLVDKAAPGETVTLPAGNYGQGLRIDKPLTLNMKGVNLLGVYGGKAPLVIANANGPVVINDLSINGRESGADKGNLAGVRISGESFRVTLNRANISETVMGVLTDNDGGKLEIYDSQFLGMGKSRARQSLSHAIYVGVTEELVIKNTIVQESHNKGHLVKSRAARTEIDSSKILGLGSNHSRLIDFPCGGELLVKNSVLQASSQSDNSDLISVGTEIGRNCRDQGRPASVVVDSNLIVVDRDQSEDEPAASHGKTLFFNWRAVIEDVIVTDNIIVEPAGRVTWQHPTRRPNLPDLSAGNRIFSSRSAAGVQSKENTAP